MDIPPLSSMRLPKPTPAPTRWLPTLTEFLLARIAEDEGVLCGEGPPHSWGRGFIVPNDPTRWLAESVAKRRIVDLHRPIGRGVCNSCYTNGMQDEWHAADWPCATLRNLATVYADHPDYREEWKP